MEWNFNDGDLGATIAAPTIRSLPQPVYMVPAPERESVEEDDAPEHDRGEGVNINHYLHMENVDNGILLNMSCHNTVKGRGSRRVFVDNAADAGREVAAFMAEVFAGRN